MRSVKLRIKYLPATEVVLLEKLGKNEVVT